MNTKYQTIVINVTAMLIVTLFLAQVDVDAQKMPGTCTIKESELSNTVMPSISKPMKFTKECRTYLIVLREVDRRLMPYLPDHGTHCSTTNCKASQISPYSHVKQPAFYMGL